MSFIELFSEIFPSLFSAFGMTLKITFISLFFAIILGLASCLMSISKFKILESLSIIYIDIIRGTPILVQAFFIYFGVPQLLSIWGVRLSAGTAGIITLSLNAGAYLSEIFRGGIAAVDSGQMEAASSLGMPYWSCMIKVILPQAVLIIIPSVVNQFIITLKDTSILSVIGLRELTQAGKLSVARNLESFKTWLIVGLMYFIAVFILSRLSRFIERKLSYAKSKG